MCIRDRVEIVDLILARVRRSDVHAVMINGELVYKEGRFLRLDQDAIARELQANASRDQEASLAEREKITQELLPYVRDSLKDWDVSEAIPFYKMNSRV